MLPWSLLFKYTQGTTMFRKLLKIFIYFFVLCYFLLNIFDLQCFASFSCIESKSESVQILFPYRVLQNIEYGSLCYAVDTIGQMFYIY